MRILGSENISDLPRAKLDFIAPNETEILIYFSLLPFLTLFLNTSSTKEAGIL
jgi:hypothetical protein